MKTYFAFLAILLSVLSYGQTTENNLIGIWQQTEYHGNDGANDYITPINNGIILTFKPEGIVEQNGILGTYTASIFEESISRKLTLIFNNSQTSYLYDVTGNKLIISSLSCKEGCADVYQKVEVKKP